MPVPVLWDEAGWEEGLNANVQSNYNAFTSGPVAVGNPLTVVAGDNLVLFVASLTVNAAPSPSAPSSVVDSQGNDWTKSSEDTGTYVNISAWTAVAGATGDITSLTVTAAGNTDKSYMYVCSVRGGTPQTPTHGTTLDAATDPLAGSLYLFFGATFSTISDYITEVTADLIQENWGIAFKYTSACAKSDTAETHTFSGPPFDPGSEALNVAVAVGTPAVLDSPKLKLKLVKMRDAALPYQVHTRML